MKQTAVEWLHEKLAKSELEDMQTNINVWFSQAKEMEKQQIETAYEQGFFDERNGKSPDEEKYYKETFKK
jgi:hypothetical protein